MLHNFIRCIEFGIWISIHGFRYMDFDTWISVYGFQDLDFYFAGKAGSARAAKLGIRAHASPPSAVALEDKR